MYALVSVVCCNVYALVSVVCYDVYAIREGEAEPRAVPHTFLDRAPGSPNYFLRGGGGASRRPPYFFR